MSTTSYPAPPLLWPALGLTGLTPRQAVQTSQGWLVQADGQPSAPCPDCLHLSHSRHSRYWRTLRDLPFQGTPVTLRLRLTRWRCRNPACPRALFPEPLAAELCAPRARQTRRFGQAIGAVAHALGGRPGQRLSGRLGLPTSSDTLLRQLKSAARRASISDAPVGVVGVDDWAWRKGHDSFGTILVDLERGHVVDLLPERSAEALADWLQRHPEVRVLSRDRQGLYAEGARRGAPQAQQVADRFHLVFNLTQAVERALALQRPHLRIPPPVPPSTASPSAPVPVAGRITPAAYSERGGPERGGTIRLGLRRQQQVARLRREQRQELFAALKRLRASGLTVAQIARRLGFHRARLDRWVRLESEPVPFLRTGKPGTLNPACRP